MSQSKTQGGTVRAVEPEAKADEPDLGAQLRQLREDVAALTNTIGTIARDGTSLARGRVADLAAGVGEKGRDLAGQAYEGARALEARASDTVRANPMTALAVAAGAGLLIGLLSRRRS